METIDLDVRVEGLSSPSHEPVCRWYAVDVRPYAVSTDTGAEDDLRDGSAENQRQVSGDGGADDMHGGPGHDPWTLPGTDGGDPERGAEVSPELRRVFQVKQVKSFS